jgi:hypothetical protein
VHAVLVWALRHPDDVDSYLKRRDEEATEIRRQLEQTGITPKTDESAKQKARLMAKWQELKPQRPDDASLSD